MDNKLTETGSSNRRVAAVPIWIKPYLTIEEAAEYTGIGRDKLYEMTSLADCPFVLYRRRENYAENKKKRQVESRASDRRIAKG